MGDDRKVTPNSFLFCSILNVNVVEWGVDKEKKMKREKEKKSIIFVFPVIDFSLSERVCLIRCCTLYTRMREENLWVENNCAPLWRYLLT